MPAPPVAHVPYSVLCASVARPRASAMNSDVAAFAKRFCSVTPQGRVNGARKTAALYAGVPIAGSMGSKLQLRGAPAPIGERMARNGADDLDSRVQLF